MSNNTFTLLHTSDWHLGQHFFGKSRQAEHQQFLDWLIETALERSVDAIVVAGDIFDTGSPPSYARQLYNQFIVKLQATGVHLVVVGGNHDSVAMLGESKELLACLNTHVIPGAAADIADQVIVLKDSKQQSQAIICAIPYLRPRDILLSHAGQTGSDKSQQLQQAISDHYQSIYAQAKQQQADIKKTQGITVPIIATGHLATVGAKTSESVRDIYIGTLNAFPAQGFPNADYIALGHIHRPQQVGGAEHIRYCGSPIPLSFDELNNNKIVLLANFAKGKLLNTEAVEVQRFQPMYVVKGNLDAIKQQITTLGKKHTTKKPAWLTVEVSGEDYLTDLQMRVQKMLADLPLEVLRLKRERTQQQPSIKAKQKETLKELTPSDVFNRRLEAEQFVGQEQEAKKQRLLQAFKQVHLEVQQGNEP